MYHKTARTLPGKHHSSLIYFLLGLLASLTVAAHGADDWTLQGSDPEYDGRSHHAMGYAGGDKIVMFAGNAAFDIDDTCIYDLSDDLWSCFWPSNRPHFRKDHAMAYVGGDKVLLHGGWDDGFDYPTTGDTWVFDVGSYAWTDMNPAGEAPYSFHSMAYIGGDKVLLFVGGYRREGVPSQWVPWHTTQVYDLSDNAWTELSPATSPPGRGKSAMARIGPDKVVIFGGFRCTQGSNPLCNFYDDTWVFDLSDNTWTNMDPPVKPFQRYGHGMAYIGDDRVVIFGGMPNPGPIYPMDDTWVYDLSDNIWTQDFNNTEPAGVWNTAMCETSHTGVSKAVLYGGDLDLIGNDDLDQTWLFGGGDFVLTELACFDGQDNDDDGATDCSDADCDGATAGFCSTGQPGICAAGTTTCSAGSASCVADSGPQTEGPPGNLSCSDLLDNDCDGTTDGFDLDCVDGNTPPGPDVEICDGTGDVCVTFDNVGPPGGDTTVTVVACGTMPDGIILNQNDPVCVDIETDAPFDLAWVCLPYDDTQCTYPDPIQQMLCELSTFDLFHCDASGCVRLYEEQDTDANVICGLTDQFSLFFTGTALDSDADGIVDIEDNCPDDYNFFQTNSDFDSPGDACDNCTLATNEGQRDSDGDNYGNFCDSDFNNDGVVNAQDLGILKSRFFSADPDADLNGDGQVNAVDLGLLKSMFFLPPGPSCCAP